MKIKEEKVLVKGQFYDYIIQTLDTKKEYKYEYVQRVSKQGGAEIIPIIKCPQTKKLVCILNYRYPLKNYVLEFPGGCIDDNESVEDCIKRELEEETGIKCDKVFGHNRSYMVDPWKSNDQNNIYYTIIDYEKTCVEGICNEQKLDEIENIKVIFLDMKNLNEEINKVINKYKCKVSTSIGYFLTFYEMFLELNNQLIQKKNSLKIQQSLIKKNLKLIQYFGSL